MHCGLPLQKWPEWSLQCINPDRDPDPVWLFYCTFTSSMTKRKHVFRSQCKFVKLVLLLGYFPSSKGLYFYFDCALFSFSYVAYTYDESCTHRKARFGIVTAVCVSVFLARLLLMCMDVESNPGPGLGTSGPESQRSSMQVGLVSIRRSISAGATEPFRTPAPTRLPKTPT